MKKIGLIGGIAPESSIVYYRSIIKTFQDRLNTKNYPEIIISSINMTQMLSFVFDNKLDELSDFLANKIKILERTGIDYGAMASNTPHIVFDRLIEKVDIPLISIVEETCKVISDSKMTRVGLFGTKSTMTGGFYNKVAKKYGIDILIPDHDKQIFIHDKYLNEIALNRIVPETKKQLVQIVNEMIDKKSIEGLILGGTELTLILNQSDFKEIKILDTTKIHVESIVSVMIKS